MIYISNFKKLINFNYIIKYRYFLIISILINSSILLYGFNFREITNLIFIDGDWNAFWFSIFNEKEILYHGDYIYAPYNIGYLIKYIELKYSFGLIFSIILFSIALSAIYYILQLILLILIPKHSFYILLFFFLSPSTAFTNFVLYKEVFFTLAFICILYSLILILYKKEINFFVVFFIFLFAILIIDLTRPYTILIVGFIYFFLFLYMLIMILLKNINYSKFLFICFILLITSFSTINYFFNEVKLVNTIDNKVREYSIPLNFMPLNFLNLLNNYYEQNNPIIYSEREDKKSPLIKTYNEQQKILENKKTIIEDTIEEKPIELVEQNFGTNVISDYVNALTQKNNKFFVNNLIEAILSIFQPSINYLLNSDTNIFIKFSFFVEILLFYLIFVIFLTSIVKNKNLRLSSNNYFLIIVLIFVTSIIYYLDNGIGSFIRHRFIFWKFVSILMIIESLNLFRKKN